jgi:peptidoglycan hydrolase FlgJ
MVTTIPGVSGNLGNQGNQGVKMAAAAQQLEAVFFNIVVKEMEKSGLQGASLGTGSDIYNGIAQRALSSQLFGGLSGSLTKSIVKQLSANAGGQQTATSTTPPQQVSSALTHGISLAGAKLAPMLLSFANFAADPAAAIPSAVASGVSGVSAPTIAQATAFARSIWPTLQQNAAQLNVPPVALLAQAALESGWGNSAPGNNIFGVKAVAGQTSTQQSTLEFVNGQMQRMNANFAAYSSTDDAVAHYTHLIRNNYPDAVGAPDVSTYATALSKGGYATDQGYVQKMVAVSRSPLMSEVLQSLGVTEQ